METFSLGCWPVEAIMTQEKESARPRPSLPLVLHDAIGKFDRWVEKQLHSEQERNTIERPLYHYTDGRGLKGIIESGQIWFTDYRDLNDPSEMVYGINLAHEVARMIATDADDRVRLFLEAFIDMFSHANLQTTLEFFIASFSRARNDLGQWRAYADNGRGFAIGFSERMFRITEEPPAEKLTEFVGPVLYTEGEVRARHRSALDEAVAIFFDTVNANAELVRDIAVGIPFMQQLVRQTMTLLTWNCLTSKHPAYAHEDEVRLVIMGMPTLLSSHVRTRLRGSEIVPYIAQPMPLREPDNIVEIVVGPAAPADAERSVRTMLDSLGVDPNVDVSRSDIPYRAS
jgi:hypothetical protein